MIDKIKTIILSRIKHTTQENWVVDRRETCLSCEHNTLNGSALKGYKFFLATLSYLYSWIMIKSDIDVLGNCTACQACSIYYKTAEEGEHCPKDFWNKKLEWVSSEEGGISLPVREDRKSRSIRSNYLNKK